MSARWIRVGALPQSEFDSTYALLAGVQSKSAVPIVLWGEEAARYLFALIAPLKYVPGRRDRWLSWGLASAVATYRQFGVPAYLDGEIYLHGRDIARTRAARIRDCALIESSFLMRFPGRRVATPSFAPEQALRVRPAARHGWPF